MSLKQRINDLRLETPLEDYKQLRDDINANIDQVSRFDLHEFNDKMFAKYEFMKAEDWKRYEENEKKLSKYVYRKD